MIEKNTIIIEIFCPAEKVYSYTLNPENTPKWIPDIAWEKRSQEKVEIGTKYVNQDIGGHTQEYVVVELEANRRFALKRILDGYICAYTYTEVGENHTVLTYEEWSPDKKEFSPLSPDYFQILKTNLESE